MDTFVFLCTLDVKNIRAYGYIKKKPRNNESKCLMDLKLIFF